VLSRVGRILILLMFVLMVAIAAFGISSVEVFFDQVLFVSESSQLNKWFQANEKYFTSGTLDPTEFYVYNNELDFSTEKHQNMMHRLDKAV